MRRRPVVNPFEINRCAGLQKCLKHLISIGPFALERNVDRGIARVVTEIELNSLLQHPLNRSLGGGPYGIDNPAAVHKVIDTVREASDLFGERIPLIRTSRGE